MAAYLLRVDMVRVAARLNQAEQLSAQPPVKPEAWLSRNGFRLFAGDWLREAPLGNVLRPEEYVLVDCYKN